MALLAPLRPLALMLWSTTVELGRAHLERHSRFLSPFRRETAESVARRR